MKTATLSKLEIKKLSKACAKVLIAHAKQQDAKDRLEFIIGCEEVAIVVLTGPTGSGKSTLLHQFASEYLAELASQMKADCSMRPVAYCIATASGHKAFDWKQLYKSTLRNLGDPFASTRQKRNDGRKPSTILPGESAPAALLREQLEAEFIARGTTVWIIDEAQHVLRGGKSGTAGDQYDILKSLAQTAGVQLILCGPFDLPTSMSHSGQLSRRTARVSLNRYRLTSEDKKVYASTLNSLLKKLPIPMAYPDVKDNFKFFYVRTLGCVGIFNDWATRAFLLAARTGEKEITLEHFKETTLSPQQLRTINQEILSGELEYGDIAAEPDEELVRSIIHNAMYSSPRALPDDIRLTTAGGSRKKAKAKNSKPGERIQTRDQVGGEV